MIVDSKLNNPRYESRKDCLSLFYMRRLEHSILALHTEHSLRNTPLDSICIKTINSLKVALSCEYSLRSNVLFDYSIEAQHFIEDDFEKEILEEELLFSEIATVKSCCDKTIEDSNKALEKGKLKTALRYQHFYKGQILKARDLLKELHDLTSKNTLKIKQTLFSQYKDDEVLNPHEGLNDWFENQQDFLNLEYLKCKESDLSFVPEFCRDAF